MLVKNWLSKNVITVDVNDSINTAIGKLVQHRINMLPVMKNGKLVGIITDRDLKRASASDATTLEIHELMSIICKIKIKEVMTKNPITVPIDYTIEETAKVLLKNRISGVPVLDNKDNVVGVITQSDLFKVIISLSSIDKRAIQLALQLVDESENIKDIFNLLKNYGCHIAGFLSNRNRSPDGYIKVYFSLYNIDYDRFDQLLKILKEKYHLLYMVDQNQNHRQIFD